MASILSIRVSNHHEQAELLYDAACAVFKSLPPASLLREFNQATYDAWYDENFSDSSDGWNSGAELYVMPMRGGVTPDAFMLITPTSGRIIKVLVQGSRIWGCEIIFPSGSTQAAGDVVIEVLLSQARVGEGLDTHLISVAMVMEDGGIISCSIDEVGVEDIASDGPFGWPEHRISLSRNAQV